MYGCILSVHRHTANSRHGTDGTVTATVLRTRTVPVIRLGPGSDEFQRIPGCLILTLVMVGGNVPHAHERQLLVCVWAPCHSTATKCTTNGEEFERRKKPSPERRGVPRVRVKLLLFRSSQFSACTKLVVLKCTAP